MPHGYAHVKGVRFENVVGQRGNFSSIELSGHSDEYGIDDVLFRDVYLGGRLLTAESAAADLICADSEPTSRSSSAMSGAMPPSLAIATCVSPLGGWVHCLGEDSHLYTFEVKEGKLQHLLKAHEKDVIGLCIHPHRNLVATWSEDGTLKLWRS